MGHNLGQIGFFQLANLARNKVPFSLFAIDLSMTGDLLSELQQIISKAHPVSRGQILERLKDLQIQSNHPIVLLCGNGDTSVAVAATLEVNGFINVYCVRGGWRELLKESESESH